MPADHNPAPYSWEALTRGERGEVYAAWEKDAVRAHRLEASRQTVWNEGKPLNDNHRRQLDAAFDELEVRR